MPRPALARLGAVAAIPVSALALAACVPNTQADGDTIAVSSTADACDVAATEAPSGTIVFDVTNDGDDVTEFYLLAPDGLRIISEVENIGPGITRQLVVQVGPGDYLTACKPGMVGDGIQAAFTVTDSGEDVISGDKAEQLTAAGDSYLLYVRDQIQTLEQKTAAFLEAYVAGDDDTARELYADARVHWERIEPVAESFGDLDPMMDAREADLAEGEEWTGWHRIEKNLWPPAEGYDLTDAERQELADKLAADTAELAARVNADDFTIDAFQVGNGAKELLDEVAAGKITGEEEIWSHTDLWDFQANVDGAAVAFGVLRDVTAETDPDLVEELDSRFAELNELLAQYGSIEEGFVLYTDLTEDQIVELARAVDALAEPLSRLTAAAVI
ncbi:iron uptake system protein EfeO [Demequina sp. SYSU T00039]|uniref:Iron uptake system protein EfeO n=1 Tax=Demequina lignilytica TaxID=3051663 RepID=A0AAW7M267_9MICO|nr:MULTISPECIES: iron uptake system protein EfeO [unclassified Demequina]MDN4478958.1 iron uptake system protein EfeO [Demequina sp. SYSU T00039-1]MDN4488833.1 iron uptake system protein EfeO [Demequina sp. SYSU T00039]MDN4491454.1 iron uptake system protein EfeO [Demequina sp. SYSU T00068]